MDNEIEKLTHLQIVQKLIGPISPVGESNEDSKRFENLQAMCELTNQLVGLIDDVATDNKDRYEASMKRAGEYAEKILTKVIGINH